MRSSASHTKEGEGYEFAYFNPNKTNKDGLSPSKPRFGLLDIDYEEIYDALF